MRGPRLSDERGIALAVAIFALVVIGALVAGTFFAGRLEQQTGENTFYASQASEAAQAALTQTVQTTSAAALLAIGSDSTGTGSSVSFGGSVGATTTIKGLTSSVWLITAIGQKTDADGNQLAARSLAQLIRLNQAEITVGAPQLFCTAVLHAAGFPMVAGARPLIVELPRVSVASALSWSKVVPPSMVAAVIVLSWIRLGSPLMTALPCWVSCPLYLTAATSSSEGQLTPLAVQ
jgi:hypothetical protein